MTPNAAYFVAGFVAGAVALAIALAVLATFAKRFLKLHICEGHAQHEYDLNRPNPNLRPPTAMR